MSDCDSKVAILIVSSDRAGADPRPWLYLKPPLDTTRPQFGQNEAPIPNQHDAPSSVMQTTRHGTAELALVHASD